MDNIKNNLETIYTRIADACTRAGRKPSEVKLLLATKTVEPERIIEAIKAGSTLIGENKVQEIKEKYEALKAIPHQKHFIGHLQTNKIKEIIRYGVSCVESVDRYDLAEKMHNRLSSEGKTMDILIQVNTSGEESKFGVAPENAVELTKQIARLDTLKIKGLMTIGLFSAETEKARKCFKILASLRSEIESLNIPGVEMKELSMGMSGDLETAIEEGATIVRVGTAIFGHRIYPDSYYWPDTKKINAKLPS